MHGPRNKKKMEKSEKYVKNTRWQKKKIKMVTKKSTIPDGGSLTLVLTLWVPGGGREKVKWSAGPGKQHTVEH